MTSPTPAARPLTGYALAILGAVLFASKGVFIKLAYARGVDTETLLALRMGLAAPIYLATGLSTLRDRKARAHVADLGLVVRVGAVGILGYWFASWTDFMGLRWISVTSERLILFTYPLFVVLLGAAFFGQPIRRHTLAAFGLAYLGLMVVVGGDSAGAGSADPLLGAGFVLASALAFAVYQLLAKPLIGRVGSTLFTCLTMLTVAVVAVAVALVVRGGAVFAVSGDVLVIAGLLTVFGTLVPSFLINAALARLSAAANGMIGTLSPIATMVLAAVVFTEWPTLPQLIGAALVLAAVGGFTLADRRLA